MTFAEKYVLDHCRRESAARLRAAVTPVRSGPVKSRVRGASIQGGNQWASLREAGALYHVRVVIG